MYIKLFKKKICLLFGVKKTIPVHTFPPACEKTQNKTWQSLMLGKLFSFCNRLEVLSTF